MLNKKYRLASVKLKDFKTVNDNHFTLKIAKNDLDYPRFGFVISKKIDKSAVVRNSLKRKLSISIEKIFDKINSGKDVVVIPRKSALKSTTSDLEVGFLKTLGK